ncbi:hypothetical protein [Flammeovirga sp. SJP92]|uniref:hypothetical protein n=1 Tax=Flammeovirga sp. SJP92 TaxID=1775430 RepID=UPI0007875D29|nr:hypothetical protein [Flammeovirga sp. SJP92]KXX66844.1 hypothetical protein AVL50_30395 [Flammeovirga sp. SJP92]
MKNIFTILLIFFSVSFANAQLVIVVQAVASTIKAPNQLDNVTFFHNGDSTIVPMTKLKKQKVSEFDSVKVNTLLSAKKVQKVYGEEIQISNVPENALYYEHTKKYRNARMSTMFAVSSWTLVLLNPYFLVVAPLPTTQAIFRDKEVDKAYVMSGKEWRTFKKEYKDYRKSFRGKNMEEDKAPEMYVSK